MLKWLKELLTRPKQPIQIRIEIPKIEIVNPQPQQFPNFGVPAAVAFQPPPDIERLYELKLHCNPAKHIICDECERVIELWEVYYDNDDGEECLCLRHVEYV